MKGKKVLLIDADPQGCGCPVDTSAVGRSTDRAGRRDSLSISLGIKRPDELDVSLATLMSKGDIRINLSVFQYFVSVVKIFDINC